MENPAEEVKPTIEVNACDSPSPEKKIPRRRFVQSTLFPQNSPEKKDVRVCGVVDGGEEDEDGEECCGSQGRRKRKQTPGRKQLSQPRRAKKVVQSDKVAFQEVLDQKSSPGEASPQTPKEKRRASARNRRSNVLPDACTGKLQDHSTLSDHNISQPVPDLWTEAKKTAEEDSRRFAGRQLHPFFSSWKVGRKNKETANPEVGHNLTENEDKNVECGPIHVYENLKDNSITSVDWSNWSFHDEIYNDPNSHEQIISSSDGSVESLRLDKILHISNNLRELFLDHESISHEEVAKKAMPPSPAHDEAEPCQPLEGIDMDHQLGEIIFRSENSSCLVSDVEQGNSTSQEWLPYSFRHTNQPQNCLWTYKYQPEKAVEVCGNGEPVKLINDWLCLWREKDLRNCKQRLKPEKCSLEEDCNSYDIDSDVESIDEEAGLKNVLLVKGPVGSGKSATIYACAKEQGFEVIEVSSSDWRSGSLIKQRFGEAVGLHWLKGSADIPKGLQSTLERKSPLSTPTGVSTADVVNGDATKPIIIPDDEITNDTVMMSQRSVCSDTNIRDSGEVKTLILFEEVDATLFEDRGFIATIQQLAQTAKRPMILTSNSCYPVLPESLGREEVNFSMPSQKELLHHVCTVCNAEKSNADTHMLEKYIKYCQGDIRKTLMHLQFWCQGQEPNSDPIGHRIYSPLMFDLNAGHAILSKIIPWGFSSQLSEHIEMEIAKASSRMEEHLALFEVSEQLENTCKLDEHVADEGLVTSIEAKKGAILSGNFDSYDLDLMTSVVNAGEASHSSGSPVAFSRRNTGKKLGFVLFDSEDEISNYEPPGKSDNLCRDNVNDLTTSAIDPESQIKWPAVNGLLDPLTGLSVCSAGEKMVESWYQCSLAANENNGQCHSGSVSCVPESTFVPETEVVDGTDISEREDQREVISPTIFENAGQPISKLDELSETTEFQCNRNVHVVDDEVGDSQNGYEDSMTFTRGCQVLDECSRMDFCRGSRRLKKCSSKLNINFVQDTWKDLQCTDFRPHITKEDKDASQAMRLACRMCNLIGEADLLLYDCKNLITESFEPGIDVVEDFFTFGWHDQQLRMTSAIAEHGYCVSAKDVAILGSKIGLDSRVDIAWEMLTSTRNSMALGKLLRRGRRTDQTLFPSGHSKWGLTVTGNSFEREREASLHEIVHSVVPPKCQLALRGSTMREYLSTLAHMSKSESHRTSESPDNTRRRRKRVAKNYLCSGSLSLSPEDISVLVAYNCSKKCPSKPVEMTQKEES